MANDDPDFQWAILSHGRHAQGGSLNWINAFSNKGMNPQLNESLRRLAGLWHVNKFLIWMSSKRILKIGYPQWWHFRDWQLHCICCNHTNQKWTLSHEVKKWFHKGQVCNDGCIELVYCINTLLSLKEWASCWDWLAMMIQIDIKREVRTFQSFRMTHLSF